MEEVILPDVGKFAVIGGDPGQDRLRRYRKSGGEIWGSPQRISRGLTDLARNPSFRPGARRGWWSLVRLKRGSRE